MANPTTLYTLPDGRLAVNVTENKTLAITDQGVVQNVITDGIVVTLPATVVGYSYTVRNGGDNAANTPAGAVSDGSMEVTISPNAADLIAGMQVTAADDKDFVNTQTTARVGDELQLLGNGTTGWNVVGVTGTWAKEA
jgi:hypothetical protein